MSLPWFVCAHVCFCDCVYVCGEWVRWDGGCSEVGAYIPMFTL
jgi:hypothetical protein